LSDARESRAHHAVVLAPAAALDLSALRRHVAPARGEVSALRGDGRHVSATAMRLLTGGSPVRTAPRCVGCNATGTTTRSDETIIMSLVFVAAGLPGGGRHYCRACLAKRDAFLAARAPRSDG
jgi:hypothetical protein